MPKLLQNMITASVLDIVLARPALFIGQGTGDNQLAESGAVRSLGRVQLHSTVPRARVVTCRARVVK